jgi:predicted RNase H-like HicB family nuclease
MQKATSRRVSDYDPRHVQHCSGCGKPLIAEPVLQCAHCGSELRLRCFAYRAGVDRYIAECIDLDILAEGNTREEAIADLQQALHGYFLTVFDGSITEGLIPRPAPLSHRLRYYLEDALDFFRGLFDRQHKASLVECRYRPEDGRLIHC